MQNSENWLNAGFQREDSARCGARSGCAPELRRDIATNPYLTLQPVVWEIFFYKRHIFDREGLAVQIRERARV